MAGYELCDEEAAVDQQAHDAEEGAIDKDVNRRAAQLQGMARVKSVAV